MQKLTFNMLNNTYLFNILNIFNIKKIRYDLIQQTIVWQLSINRKISANTKNISQIRGSTKKIYQQKGSGRARHGSVRAVQFKGGEVVFGPSNNKKYNFKVNKKSRKLALLHAFSLKLRTNSIYIIKSFVCKNFKTKDFINFFGKSNKKIIFIDNNFDNDLYLATKNLFNVSLFKVIGINVLDIIQADYIYISDLSLRFILNTLKL